MCVCVCVCVCVCICIALVNLCPKPMRTQFLFQFKCDPVPPIRITLATSLTGALKSS